MVVIPDGHHGMATDIGLPFHGQGHEAGVHDDGTLKRLVDADAEDEGHAGRQGAPEGIEIPILQEEGLLELQAIGRFEGFPGRHVRELGRHVGPVGLMAGAELSDDLRRQVDAGAGVLANRPQLRQLVPVDVKARGHERLATLTLEVELQRRRDRIGGTAPQLCLVVDRWAAGPEVDRLREPLRFSDAEGIVVERRRIDVAQGRRPAVAADVSRRFTPRDEPVSVKAHVRGDLLARWHAANQTTTSLGRAVHPWSASNPRSAQHAHLSPCQLFLSKASPSVSAYARRRPFRRPIGAGWLRWGGSRGVLHDPTMHTNHPAPPQPEHPRGDFLFRIRENR